MRKTLASILSTGASPWKFLLLAATLLFSYAIPVHADDHEEAAVVEEAEAGPVDDYNGLLEHFNVVDGYRSCTRLSYAPWICNFRIGIVPTEKCSKRLI